jgi:hypothetical protein
MYFAQHTHQAVHRALVSDLKRLQSELVGAREQPSWEVGTSLLKRISNRPLTCDDA